MIQPLFNDITTGSTVTYRLNNGKEITKPIWFIRRATPTADSLAIIMTRNGRVVPHCTIVSIQYGEVA